MLQCCGGAVRPRYKLMTSYMPKVGSMGLDMMYRTCTVQVRWWGRSGNHVGVESARLSVVI